MTFYLYIKNSCPIKIFFYCSFLYYNTQIILIFKLFLINFDDKKNCFICYKCFLCAVKEEHNYMKSSIYLKIGKRKTKRKKIRIKNVPILNILKINFGLNCNSYYFIVGL